MMINGINQFISKYHLWKILPKLFVMLHFMDIWKFLELSLERIGEQYVNPSHSPSLISLILVVSSPPGLSRFPGH